MPRPQLHSTDDILDAARELVLDGGARAATLDGIVAASGAPKGSVYHRFPTLNELLAAMWIRAVRRSQEHFLAALDDPDPMDAAIAAALALLDFAQTHPADARLLASLRRQDLITSIHDTSLRTALEELNAPIERAILELARRLHGRATRAAVEQTVFAVIDLPLGAVRRHLVAGDPLPRSLRGQLEAAARAALEQTRPPRRRR
jgi:AcrR family transcriptional regulator